MRRNDNAGDFGDLGGAVGDGCGDAHDPGSPDSRLIEHDSDPVIAGDHRRRLPNQVAGVRGKRVAILIDACRHAHLADQRGAFDHRVAFGDHESGTGTTAKGSAGPREAPRPRARRRGRSDRGSRSPAHRRPVPVATSTTPEIRVAANVFGSACWPDASGSGGAGIDRRFLAADQARRCAARTPRPLEREATSGRRSSKRRGVSKVAHRSSILGAGGSILAGYFGGHGMPRDRSRPAAGVTPTRR